MRKHPAAEPQSTGPLPAAIAVAFIGVVVVSLWLDSRDGPSPALAFADAPAPSSAAAPAARPPDKARQPVPVPAAVTAFVTFAAEESAAAPPQVAGYTAEGVTRLADAMAAARNGSPLWVDRAKRLKAAAGEVVSDADPVRRAEAVHEMFMLAARWIGDLSPSSRLSSASLLQAAEAISPDRPLRDQKQAVDRFFDQAAAALSPPSRAGSSA
jgi:hypothetical protein